MRREIWIEEDRMVEMGQEICYIELWDKRDEPRNMGQERLGTKEMGRDTVQYME